ncbi:MAG TPA: hypothetical protein VNE62_03145, partial [Actinomycetota bacterium]|nr:hypothetical protein [Actinomycetota bacterium]
AESLGLDPLQLALGGGEDYELLVALDSPVPHVPLHPVGRVVDEGLWLVRDGEQTPLPVGGWDSSAAGSLAG